MNEMTPEEKLSEAREVLHQEWVTLQILGRALTEEENARLQILSEAVSLIDEALAILQVEEDLFAEEEEWEEEEELEEEEEEALGDEDFNGW